MHHIFTHSFYVLVVTCLTLMLTCSSQFANASEQYQPDFQKIENTLQDYLVEENVPWLEELKAITSKGSVEQSLLSDLEDLVQSYPARSDIFETVAPLYLMLLSSDELFRSIDFFSRLRRFGIPIPDSIFAYLNTLLQEDTWLLRTLDQYLVQEVAGFPEVQALQWFNEKLLEQRQILYKGITTLEQAPNSDDKGVLRHFLVALLMTRKPFLRWPAADRYLSDQQRISPEHIRVLTLYRSLLRLRFAEGADHETGRSFLGMKLFASAGEMPTFQEEVDRLLARLEDIKRRKDDWRIRSQALEEQEETTLEQYRQKLDSKEDTKKACEKLAETHNQKVNAFSREWNQVHKPREDECNKRLDQFEKVNLDIKPCTASSKHCVSRSETLDNRRTKVANIKRQLAECKRWWQEGEAWKAQFRAFSKQVKAETEQCDRKRAEIRAELKQYQAEWQVWKQQRAGLDSEREALDEDYETCLQEKIDLRARIVTMQEELESIQPVAGHCRADDCPRLGFPQAGLDDFAHTVGDTYLAMAGPGGKLKTGKKVADAVAKLKPINLPSWRKIEIDMDHIVSGHQRGGARIMKDSNRSIFPEYMSRDEIERTIRQAYRYGKRIETQENRIHVRGNGIDIWINKITKKIVTAYPSAN